MLQEIKPQNINGLTPQNIIFYYCWVGRDSASNHSGTEANETPLQYMLP